MTTCKSKSTCFSGKTRPKRKSRGLSISCKNKNRKSRNPRASHPPSSLKQARFTHLGTMSGFTSNFKLITYASLFVTLKNIKSCKISSIKVYDLFLKAYSIRIQFFKFHFNVSFCSLNTCILVNQCEYHIIRWIHLLLKRIEKSNASKMKIQYKRACLRATWIKLSEFSSLHQISNYIQLTINVWSSLDTSLSRTGDFECLQQLMLLWCRICSMWPKSNVGWNYWSDRSVARLRMRFSFD